jgi:hypothetical protein
VTYLLIQLTEKENASTKRDAALVYTYQACAKAIQVQLNAALALQQQIAQRISTPFMVRVVV